MTGAPHRVPVFQGDFQISARPDMVFFAVLGSCVSACLHDATARIGGMNHFLLPAPGASGIRDMHAATSFGIQSMELLINALLKRGAERARLRAHLYGGANVSRPGWDIGTRNAAFARQFLADEGIEVVHADVGGTDARRVEFDPVAGKARARRVRLDEEPRIEMNMPPVRPAGDVDLFVGKGGARP